MADYVVDTNVWVWMDKTIAEVQSIAEIDCIEACQHWLNDFIASDDGLVVDWSYKIIGEYRENIRQDRAAYQMLAALETKPQPQLIWVNIELDERGFAVLPFETIDEKDRKFVAAALAHHPTPPIVDASDTHWEQDRETLTAAGITVQELCPDYIQERLHR